MPEPDIDEALPGRRARAPGRSPAGTQDSAPRHRRRGSGRTRGLQHVPFARCRRRQTSFTRADHSTGTPARFSVQQHAEALAHQVRRAARHAPGGAPRGGARPWRGLDDRERRHAAGQQLAGKLQVERAAAGNQHTLAGAYALRSDQRLQRARSSSRQAASSRAAAPAAHARRAPGQDGAAGMSPHGPPPARRSRRRRSRPRRWPRSRCPRRRPGRARAGRCRGGTVRRVRRRRGCRRAAWRTARRWRRVRRARRRMRRPRPRRWRRTGRPARRRPRARRSAGPRPGRHPVRCRVGASGSATAPVTTMPSATLVMQARWPMRPSTVTTQSKQAPMPQCSPRGAPLAVRRNATMPAADSAAAMVSPSSAAIGLPSNAKLMGRPTGRMDRCERRIVGVLVAAGWSARAICRLPSIWALCLTCCLSPERYEVAAAAIHVVAGWHVPRMGKASGTFSAAPRSGSTGWRANPSRVGDLGMNAPSRDPFPSRRCRHV